MNRCENIIIVYKLGTVKGTGEGLEQIGEGLEQIGEGLEQIGEGTADIIEAPLKIFK